MSKALLLFRNGIPVGMTDLEGAPIEGGEYSTYETSDLEGLISFNGDALPYAETVGNLIRYWTGEYDDDGYGVWAYIDILPSSNESGGEGGTP